MLLNNRYRIIRTLGSGGFGETFLAEDTQMPSRRTCVIKQLRPIQDNSQVYQLVQQRFGREAAILEELGDGSSQVPRLYAYFNEHGQFYLVQEYIEGKTLPQMLQEIGLMDENSVKEILMSILPVLDYVHSKGIVHRDIKPENILIDTEGKPVLIDFGAVKETLGTILTPSGNATKSIVIGTPGFMATEQSVGRPMFASDIYSLGLTAIYLLTGKMPQELATDPATGKILWRQYAPGVKEEFADILDKAIRFHVRERFSSANIMLQALQTGVLSLTSGVSYTNSSDTIPPGVTLPPQTHLNQTHLNQTHLSQTHLNQTHLNQTHLNQTHPSQTHFNTIAVPAPSSIQSSNSGNGKGILLGSLIAGSLIGASIIIGFALNRQPQTVTKQTQTTTNTKQPQPTTSPREISEEVKLEEPQKIPTPTVTPDLEPEIKPTFIPRVNTQRNPQIEPPITPQIPQRNNTTPDLPIPQPTPQSPPIEPTPQAIQQPSPAQAVQKYYSQINQGQYKTAWDSLSTEFKDNQRLHPNGYFSYLSWWRGKVEKVNVEQVRILEANQDTATVDASLSYSMKNGKVVPSSVRFLLVWDAQNAKWVVRDAT